MPNDSFEDFPEPLQRPLRIGHVVAVLLGGVASVIVIVAAFGGERSPETWDRIKDGSDPCVFKAYADNWANDSALRRAARAKEEEFGPCLSEREREELAAQAERERIAAEEREAAERAERARATQERARQRQQQQRAQQAAAAQRDDNAYANARRANTISSYRSYLTSFPNGRHVSEAREAQRRLDDAAFAAARRTNTSSAYTSYVSAYPNGRHLTEARAAIEQLRPARDVTQLTPRVRRAVESARNVYTQAETMASNARYAAQSAERAAHRHTRATQDDGAMYAGDEERDRADGYGVLEYSRGERSGERYAGQWREGRKEGLGVFTRPNGSWSATAWRRFEGQFSANKPHGLGIYHRTSGRYVGQVNAGFVQGVGTFIYPNGEIYEGEWAQGSRHGVGVLWTRDGRVSLAGVWTNDRFSSVPATTP